MRIQDIREPNLFQRLVQALFSAELGPNFQVVDDSAGDRGNDGYDSAQRRMIAIYCPEKQSTSESLLKKGRSDLAKIALLKQSGIYQIDEWMFVTPNALPERVQATLRQESEVAGLRAGFASHELLESLYLRFPHLRDLFPELSYPAVQEELRLVKEKLDQLIAGVAADEEAVRDVSTMDVSREDSEPEFAVEILSGFVSDRLADIQRRLWAREKGAEFELEQFRMEAATPRERLAATMVQVEFLHETLDFKSSARVSDLGIGLADGLKAKAEAAVFRAKRAFALNQLLVFEEVDFQGRLEMSVRVGVHLVTEAEANLYDNTVPARHREIEDLFRQAHADSRDSRNLFALFSVVLLYATSRVHLGFIYTMPGRARRTPDIQQRTDRLKSQMEASYDLAISIALALNSKRFLAMAYSNFANDLRFFGDRARALAHAMRAIGLAEELGDEHQLTKTRELVRKLKSSDPNEEWGGILG